VWQWWLTLNSHKFKLNIRLKNAEKNEANHTSSQLEFPCFKYRKAEVDFFAGHMGSDVIGCLLLRQADLRMDPFRQLG